MNLILEPRWQPGRAITTPSTRLRWGSLAEWCDAWLQLHHRKDSGVKYAQQRKHLEALPLEMIQFETNAAVLEAFLFWVPQVMGIPRGRRVTHPTTPLLQAAGNRLSKLERSCQ